MMKTTRPNEANTTDWHENAFDIIRGLSAYTGSSLIEGLAKVIAKYPDADLGTAFNHKQVGSKIWAREKLFESLGGKFKHIVLLGGWYGVLPAMFFDDGRFDIELFESIDIDPEVGEIAETLNARAGAHFRTVTQDMYALDYGTRGADLVINTSCEHIADLPAWLSLLPRGTKVLLQSNDYFSEPTHINCVPSLEAFREQTSLSQVAFAGSLKMKKYTRFMVIGTV
ncbi:class I SAM-dependent methyltransferase [Pararhizobium sp. YC-54]|uniref:class I SAM-dependent methyltransferase n=1 Tax=Pararhizobium sp. YC-54 TaxID=2986920 RepID=UPI0021F79C06|nr:class I SAM-dependent methyltransferase [Pararhizobium sp. YC-54]MCW0000930.1 class I SAM-dependent methyltransferase [Pararhizobium sp. YC-54]